MCACLRRPGREWRVAGWAPAGLELGRDYRVKWNPY